MKAALKTTKTRRFRGVRAILTTLCAAAICAGAGLGLSACQEEEPTSVTITVVCTDEMRAALADRNITDAEGWLKQAAAQFAAAYQGLEVTVNVVGTDVAKAVSDLVNPPVPGQPGEDETTEPEDAEGINDTDGLLIPSEPDAAVVIPEGNFESDPEDTPPPDAIAGSIKGAFGLGTSVKDANAPAAAPALVPDVLFGAFADLNPAVLAGKAVPLDDLITPDMKTYVPASILAAGKQVPNDKTYLIPFSAAPYIFIIDGDLFRAAGIGGYAPIVSAISDTGDGTATYDLTTPSGIVAEAYGRMVVQSWTPKEWTEVLETLVQQLPSVAKKRFIDASTKWSQDVEGARLAAKDKGEDPDAAAAAFGARPELLPLYPMMMYGAGDEGMEYLMALMGMFGGSFFDEDGYVWIEDAEGIASGDWLATAAARGYFPPNAESLTYQDCVDLFENGQLGILAIRTDQVKDFLLSAVNVPEVVPEDAEGEGAAAEGEAAEEISFDDLYMTRRLSFVTFPRWDLDAVDAWKASLGLATAEEGEEAVEVSSASTYEYEKARGLVPAEFYGFAVIDNGNELAVKVAKEFVRFVMGSDDWLAYEVVEGQIPADTFIFDTYAKSMPFTGQFRESMEWVVNLSGNVPEWDKVLSGVQEAFAAAVTGKKTPVEITASINKAANAVLEPAWLEVTLHE